MLAVTDSVAADLVGQVVGLAQHVEHALGDELGTGVEGARLEQHDELVAGRAARRCRPARTTVSSRAATALRNVSPTAWPKVSLMCLKPSMSM